MTEQDLLVWMMLYAPGCGSMPCPPRTSAGMAHTPMPDLPQKYDGISYKGPVLYEP